MMREIKNPKTEALAFRIWAFASGRDWNVSIKDVAAHLDENMPRVRAICKSRGWHLLMRKDAGGDGRGIGHTFAEGKFQSRRDIAAHVAAYDRGFVAGVIE